MKNRRFLIPLLAASLVSLLGAVALDGSGGAAQAPVAGDWYLDITRPGTPVRMAIPEIVPMIREPELSPDISSHISDDARMMTRVLKDDIAFAGVYRMLPERFYDIVADRAAEGGELDYYQWESVGADILVETRLDTEDGQLTAEVWLHAIRARERVFGRRYTADAGAARDLAHRVADDILMQAGGYRGVAQTRFAFSTTRRRPGSKEIYLMDYDGHAQRPVTVNGSLNLTPTWSPSGRAIAYISYREGAPALYLAFLYQGRGEKLTNESQSFTPAWSPDGRRIAFTSSRDGQSEIYVIDADGGNLQRLTNNRAIEVSPTWSPNGRAIAFTSDRTGSPQIYVMDQDGLNLRRVSFEGSYNDSPAWSPSRQSSEIAYASRIERGPFDIVVHDLETRQTRQLTSGRGSNESPSWAPNGLHLAFASDRSGDVQIFTMRRDGSDVRQLTREGSNTTPRWGNPPGPPPE